MASGSSGFTVLAKNHSNNSGGREKGKKEKKSVYTSSLRNSSWDREDRMIM